MDCKIVSFNTHCVVCFIFEYFSKLWILICNLLNLFILSNNINKMVDESRSSFFEDIFDSILISEFINVCFGIKRFDIQQATVIQDSIDFKVGVFCGSSNGKKSHHEWEKEMEWYEVSYIDYLSLFLTKIFFPIILFRSL